MTAFDLPEGQILIGDQWLDSAKGGVHAQINPATGLVQATVPMAGSSEVDAAVRAPRAAYPAWRRLAVNERRDILLRFGSILREHADELAFITTQEMGVPIGQTGFVPLVAEWVLYYAGWVDKLDGTTTSTVAVPGFDYVLSEPYGVVVSILPWNGPVFIAGMSAVPAIAAGNCVVMKPSELAPFSSIRFAQLALDAGLPSGVLNVIVGGPDAGQALVAHPDVDKIVFTGGADTAKLIMKTAAEALTPVALELGGKSANIVFPDADLDAATLMAASLGIAASSGQGCALPTRLFVHREILKEMTDRLVAMAESFKVGMPLELDTVMGPVISDTSLQRILGMVDRAVKSGAARLLSGGHRLSDELAGGYFIGPTILGEVDPQAEIAQQEIFGPVLSIMGFDNEDEAVRLANATPWGLAAFLHTTDLSTAHRVADRLEAGYVSVNGFAGLTPSAPFGGVKDSGFGREGGRYGIEEFLRPKNVFIAI